MTTWHELRRTSRGASIVLSVLFVMFNAFALIRALPVNSRLHENRDADRGVYHRHVYRVFRLAKHQAAQPFFQVKNHALFFDRDPGMFMFVAELLVRAGATTPLPNQLLSIALWNVGLLFLFLWLLNLFHSELAALTSVGFLLTTPFVLFYSSSIHHEPWCFAFFNLTCYCYLRYLRLRRPRDFAATWISYFLLCQSYWFYYMSAGLLLIALQWRERRLSTRDTVVLALVPIVATLTTFLQVVYALGGIEPAWFRMKDIAAARTFDLRIENSRWYPHKRFVRHYHIKHYPQIVRDRIELISGTRLEAFAAMLLGSVALAGPRAWRQFGWLLWVSLAGVSWQLVMIQHTVIHSFAGMYGWFAWVIIVATFVCEAQSTLQRLGVSMFAPAFALALVGFALQREYIPYLTRYVENACASHSAHRSADHGAGAQPHT